MKILFMAIIHEGLNLLLQVSANKALSTSLNCRVQKAQLKSFIIHCKLPLSRGSLKRNRAFSCCRLNLLAPLQFTWLAGERHSMHAALQLDQFNYTAPKSNFSRDSTFGGENCTFISPPQSQAKRLLWLSC